MSRSVPVSSIETSSLQENLAVSEVSSTLGSTLMDTALVAHTWHIHNFSTHQELLASGDALESLRFGTSDGQHEFYMKLFPQGKDDECAGFISLFLYIQKCPQPRLRFRVNFVIETADGPRGCALNRNVVTINRGGIVTASKFFSVEMLKARHERFVPDDTLTVGVQLTIFGDAHCEKLLTADEEDLDETTSAFLSPSHSSSLNALSPAARVRKVAVSATPQRSPLSKNVASSDSAFGCLLNNDTFSDFRIEVGVGSDKREFSVHRALITPRSGFFSALFHNNQNKEVIEGKAKFDDVSSKTMLSLLTYLYTGSCPNIEDNTIDLLFVADRFCVDGLKKECEEELMRGLRVDNAALRIQVADRVGASRLLNKAKRFFVANREVIMKTEDWEELKKDQPALAVRVLEDCWLLSDRSSKRIKLS